MNLSKKILSIVSVMVLGIGSISMANAATTTVFQHKSAATVHMQSSVSQTKPAMKNHTDSQPAVKSQEDANSIGSVTISPVTDTQDNRNQPVINPGFKGNAEIQKQIADGNPMGMHKSMRDNVHMGSNLHMTTDHYVYMDKHVTNMAQHMASGMM